MADATTRLARAVHLDAVQLEGGAWRVSGGAQAHEVDAEASACDCYDFSARARGGVAASADGQRGAPSRDLTMAAAARNSRVWGPFGARSRILASSITRPFTAASRSPGAESQMV